MVEACSHVSSRAEGDAEEGQCRAVHQRVIWMSTRVRQILEQRAGCTAQNRQIVANLNLSWSAKEVPTGRLRRKHFRHLHHLPICTCRICNQDFIFMS